MRNSVVRAALWSAVAATVPGLVFTFAREALMEFSLLGPLTAAAVTFVAVSPIFYWFESRVFRRNGEPKTETMNAAEQASPEYGPDNPHPKSPIGQMHELVKRLDRGLYGDPGDR